MLFATQSQSIAGAQKYFETALVPGDYYLGREVVAQWRGKGVEVLNLEEGTQVTKEHFFALLRGHHPLTGRRLLQRVRKDRRPGTDLTFSVPKSVSLAWAINGDERILDVLRQTVHDTMREDIEPLMERRVRKGRLFNSKCKKQTGKLLYADFLHHTSRPVDGVPDPHLHIHAFVMNWTEEDGKHYAAEMEEIVRQRPSLQAKFESRLARRLVQLGYTVGHVRYQQSGRLKRGWEIDGVGRETIEKFSRRTTQIEAYAQAHGISDAEAKGQLGKLTRERKGEGKSIDQLRPQWQSRLTPAERAAFARLLDRQGKAAQTSSSERAIQSVQYALDHYLYRQSTVERHQLVGTALEHGLTLKVKDVEQAIDSMKLIEREVAVEGGRRRFVTTRAVLQAERRLIAFAREGRGTRKAISTSEHKFARDWLNEQQQAAVRQVLHSRDTVMAIVGGAGTGKTSLMQEAVEAVGKHRKQVFTFAPSTGAREVLQDKGFHDAQTVEHLIRNTRLHPKLKKQVIWIDEAGLVDVRSMNKIFDIAKAQQARVVLSGDPRQHASPRRGEAMRLLENEAGLKMARVESIQRQQGRYRRAVELISKGYQQVDRAGTTGLLAGFDLLDSMGKIHEIQSEERHTQLANTYLQARCNKKTALVIAPTHAEGQAVTAQIRTQLKQQGQLTGQEKSFTQYRSLNLSEAERGEARTYAQQEGLIVQFHQNTKGGFQRGERFRVVGADNGRVQLAGLKDNQIKALPLDAPDRFEVYTQSELKLAAGDKIRFSLGGTAKDDKRRISNGRLDEVQGFDRRGNIVLKNGWTIGKDYGHLDLGYVITSHSSQGKDRDLAIGAMGSQSLPAINARQFYVTVSRGRDDVVLFVDDKAKVRNAIQRSGQQLSATELIRTGREDVQATREAQRQQIRHENRMQRSLRNRVLRWWRNLENERSQRVPVGRHRDADQRAGLLPSLERSMET